MKGSFLELFFEQRGFTEAKSNGEMDVLCPFMHDKGYEQRPSAHVNIEQGIFHCKTCAAEGRFHKGGLSETGFISAFYGMSHSDAIQFLSSQNKDYDGDDTHHKFVGNLLGNETFMQMLSERGITEADVAEYQLGYDGGSIVYPVFVNGVMLDRRHYNTSREGNEAKIKSEKDAKPLLFPYDHWYKDLDTAPFTLLTAGENDTLIARKHGYNAVTSTMGEGSFPKIFLKLFEGKKVIICYDCDEAGRRAASSVAFYLREAKADVHIMDLGLEGTKEDKDITDFFIKHEYSKAQFDARISLAVPFDEEQFTEEKNKEYPLVDLWEVPEGRYHGVRLSSRVIMMGKFSSPMEAPTAVHTTCESPIVDEEGIVNFICQNCPFRKNHERWWILEDKQLDKVLELVEVNKAQQKKALRQFVGIPEKCPGRPSMNIRERKHVTKVIFSPDVDTENELTGFKAAEQHAYVLGLNLEDGGRYRAYFRRYAHPTDKQKIVMVVDRVEDSDNSVNAFRITPEILEQLSQFQATPEEAMKARYELAREVVGTFVHPMVVNAINISFHSVLEFNLFGNYEKGFPEGLIVSESRQGKTSTAKRLEAFYRLGNFTTVKNASTAGLLGGADKLPSGEFRISWGKIPLNHKGLLILDEMSGLSKDVMATLTDMRSEGIALIEKIVKGKAPAKTRLLWLSNPRANTDGNSLSIEDYPHGVKVILDLVGRDEDIARFDFVYIMPTSKKHIPPKFDDEREKEHFDNLKTDYTPYHHLIQWAWSRKSNQIKFDKGIDRYLWHISEELNERYDTHIKFFSTEAWKKIARIATSVAVMCFSHDGTGENVLVKKEHIDWAAKFLVDCYDNETFRLREFAEQAKFTTTTNEEVNNLFAMLVTQYPMMMKSLANQTEIGLRMLEAVSGLDHKAFGPVISNLLRNGLVQQARDNIMATKRFRQALLAYRENIDAYRIRPLSEQGGSFI